MNEVTQLSLFCVAIFPDFVDGFYINAMLRQIYPLFWSVLSTIITTTDLIDKKNLALQKYTQHHTLRGGSLFNLQT